MKLYDQFQYEWMRYRYIDWIPEKIRRKVDLFKNIGFPKYYLDSNVIFIHIPKSAGSSIAHALYGKSIAHMPASFYMRANSEAFTSRVQFAVVRDPWDRAYSAYRFLKAGGTKLVPVENAEKYTRFDSFERFVKEYLAENYNGQLDQVLRPQYRYVYDDDGDLLVQHVGRVESLGETIEFLEPLIGRISFPWLNSAERKGSDSDEYSPQLINIVGDIYSRDIELFGYQR